ncbi:type II toxin-antitoxin system VapC family toxin [Candidatus Woesearchaeota archaeon]|nr:type II toxin-antitoxin system VapC family toxin [Candidatus Woesearchaeota archaeon]
MGQMENKICLDTDFLVNFLRNNKEEIEFIKENEANKDLATTYINLFELYYGAYKSNKKNINLKAISVLLSRINILNFSNESVQKAGEILAKLEREGKSIEFRDIFIGTIALVNNYSIKTNNIKHFNRIEGLNILD